MHSWIKVALCELGQRCPDPPMTNQFDQIFANFKSKFKHQTLNILTNIKECNYIILLGVDLVRRTNSHGLLVEKMSCVRSEISCVSTRSPNLVCGEQACRNKVLFVRNEVLCVSTSLVWGE